MDAESQVFSDSISLSLACVQYIFIPRQRYDSHTDAGRAGGSNPLASLQLAGGTDCRYSAQLAFVVALKTVWVHRTWPSEAVDESPAPLRSVRICLAAMHNIHAKRNCVAWLQQRRDTRQLRQPCVSWKVPVELSLSGGSAGGLQVATRVRATVYA